MIDQYPDRNNSSTNGGLLAKLWIGVSPISVVGDVALALGFYDLLKKSGQDAV